MNSVTAPRTQAAPTPDLAAVKTRQQGAWGSGDYSRIGVRLQLVGETLCEAANVRADERVLDVAAGNGNASLAAARRFARVTSTDYVPELLEAGRRRAEADGLEIDFRVADAEKLPFGDASFDVVLSTYGVMFTPNQEIAAAEMMRVLRPGGRIGLANWTPEGFIGQLFKVVGRHAPPPAGVKPASLWGTETRLVELFGPQAADIRAARRPFTMRFRSAEHWLDYFRTWYGPVLKAFAALDDAGKQALEADILELLHRLNGDAHGTLVIPSEYLEVVVVKAGTESPRR
jgi:SAM-dependent methyltransferase